MSPPGPDRNQTPSLFTSPAGKRKVMELYDRMLARWPVDHERLEIPTRHGKTFIIAAGAATARPLILLHGAGSNSLMWIDDFALYSRHFRVYAVDLIGEAGKSAATRPPWRGPAYEEWLANIYEGLQVRRASVVGISQGGWTALRFATARPEQIDRLVLICPGGITLDRISFILYALVLRAMGSWGIRRLVRMLFGEQSVPEPVLAAMTLTVSHFRHRLGLPPLFTDQELARLTMPTHLIGGTRDVLRDTAGIAARLRRLVPHLKVELIPGAGHAINDTAASIMPFLLADGSSNLKR